MQQAVPVCLFLSATMKPLAKFIGAALIGAVALLAAPQAQAQVGVNINIGAPGWGPRVPYGTQYYYIPEIDGYYDLYSQQYIVFQDGYWVPLPQLYGYDPYLFHPVAIQYRGREPWEYVRLHRDRYPTRVVVVRPGRGLPPGQAKKMYRQGYREGYRDDRREDRDDDRGRGNSGNGGYSNGPRGGHPQPQYPGGNGYGGNSGGDGTQSQAPQPGGNGGNGGGQAHGGPGNNGQDGNGHEQGGGRHGRD